MWYRISSFGTLPRCPICGDCSWDLVIRQPFGGRPSMRRDASS
jgi:hypothetical protein